MALQQALSPTRSVYGRYGPEPGGSRRLPSRQAPAHTRKQTNKQTSRQSITQQSQQTSAQTHNRDIQPARVDTSNGEEQGRPRLRVATQGSEGTHDEKDQAIER